VGVVVRRFQVPNLFDRALWSRAGWWRVSYLLPPERPPVLVLLFRDLAAGCSIFKAWLAALGEIDGDDLLRVAIIEDDAPGAAAVRFHLGFNVDAIAVAAARCGAFDVDDAATRDDAWCHMRVPHVGVFQPFLYSYEEHGRYLIVPATVEGSPVAVPYLGIGKQRLEFQKF
jgi:hypothetical protein